MPTVINQSFLLRPHVWWRDRLLTRCPFDRYLYPVVSLSSFINMCVQPVQSARSWQRSAFLSISTPMPGSPEKQKRVESNGSGRSCINAPKCTRVLTLGVSQRLASRPAFSSLLLRAGDSGGFYEGRELTEVRTLSHEIVLAMLARVYTAISRWTYA